MYKPNQLICGTGQAAVVSGWTVKDAIAKHLRSHEYAVIGQLYSPTRGISFLIRNLLANPHVRYLIIINATKEDNNAGGCECLRDFFCNGFAAGKSDTGRDSWVIKSRVTGYIDIEIEASALEKLRQSIECFEAKSITDAVTQVKSCVEKDAVEPWGKSLEFPQVEVAPTVLPGPLYGHRIEGKNIAETWVKIIHRIKRDGTIRPTGYDGYIQELIDLMAVVTDEPEDFYFPEPNYLPVDPETIKNYIPEILEDSTYIEGVKYTYSQRLRSWFGRDQIEDVIQKLIGEIDAASAVMNLWDSGGNINRRADGTSDHQHSGSPCLNHIWVRVVNGELSLTATLRSNDMFGAWVANAMGLRALQKHIRDEIVNRSHYTLKMGPLITVSQSAHIYDDTWENADRLIKQQYSAICKQMDYCDPSGNFLIEIADNKIVVSQTTPGSGEIVARYSSKDALKLIREICNASPAIRPDHAGYLGLELQKAADCLKTGKQYIQDR
ncbi:thymidylate synthase [Argonema galeatum]|uniref:thymidylate synthase n=1 Tax=Argonema galeatum TaxID=2942762 RepID=UPI00201242B0|nr:thymidylate synthase [Argonema galeatum]MCL1467750.1 thymidylate synthase [Argonema galeatum A003/A1]